MENKNNIIEIEAQRFSIDWVYSDIHEVNVSKIFGFELHWRGDDWHVVVETKEKSNDGYYSYDLDHWVFPKEIVKLIKDKRAKILKIVNDHSSANFIGEVLKITEWLNDELIKENDKS